MNVYLRIFIAVFAVAGVITACRKDDAPVKLLEAKITQSDIAGVNGPTSGKVNQTLSFNLVWNNADSTQRFDGLRDSAFDNTRIIRLFAKTVNRDTLKVDTADKSIFYRFKATAPGTYFLKFYNKANSDKAAIIDTVIIK